MQIALSKSTIRSLRPDDAESITRHVGTYSVARYMSAIPHPYALRDAESWLATVVGQSPEAHFAIAVDDVAAGVIGLHLGDRGLAVCAHDSEIGYWLGESFWGRGIMTEALSALTEWAFAELRLARLHAVVYAPNLASARVLEKAGYRYEGCLRARYFREGRFIDGLAYAQVRLPG